MKESFSELYSRLYRENFEELEALRSKAKKSSVTIIFIVAIIFITAMAFPLIIPLAFVGFILYIIVKSAKAPKVKDYPPQVREKTYQEVFKEKIVGPIIENTFGAAKYNPKAGLEQLEYRRAGYNEHFDRYRSEDLIIAPLNLQDGETTFITFSEVHTERESEDSEGRTTYVTIFHGLAGSFLIPKATGTKIYIRNNGRVSNWNKNKVKMDMSEFEKLFDVESEDKILAMRILTSDVMAEMIDLYQKYKYRFEISILDDKVYMRLATGAVFEPNVFGSSMEYKQLEKYYLILRALTSIASHISDTISRLEI